MFWYWYTWYPLWKIGLMSLSGNPGCCTQTDKQTERYSNKPKQSNAQADRHPDRPNKTSTHLISKSGNSVWSLHTDRQTPCTLIVTHTFVIPI